MPREITTHHVNGLNESIRVAAIDEAGPGGANHEYLISIDQTIVLNGKPEPAGRHGMTIPFQKGGIQEAGVNGISNEALLAILIDRMQGFCEGPFPCRENSIARTYLEEAMMWLQKRTRDRMQRGVEGQEKA